MKKYNRMVNFVATPEDHDLWKGLAKEQRRSLGEWLRAAAQAYAGVEIVVEPIVVDPTPRKLVRKQNEKGTKLLELAKQAKAGPCDNRLPKGAFCKRCGKIHT